MRKALVALLLFSVASCNSPQTKELKEQHTTVSEEKHAVCTPDTPLAEGKGVKVTLADFRYTWKLLSPQSRNFFAAHPEELLKRMVNRRLVVNYVESTGLAERSGLEKEMEEFKKEWLARYYVSAEAKKRLKPVTNEEIVERFKELFPKKDPSKMSKGDKDFIRHELEVKHFDQAVKSLYDEVTKKLKIERKGDKLVASCCGLEVEAPYNKKREKELQNYLKEKFLTEYFYRQALKAGYDKLPRFKHMYEEYYATRAVELFRKELEKGIKVTDEEAKAFYEKNKERFKMPDRVKAVVFYFKSKERALEAKKMLESGKSWQDVARRLGQFNAKEKFYYRDPKDPIGALVFMNGNPKKGQVFVADFGGKYVTVYVEKFVPGGVLPYKEVKNYVKLVLKRQKLRQAEVEKLRELWKEKGVKLENLSCLKGSL
ncbi:peptidyl-prolyl cis-trans isomerase [Thermovibrio ammonificans]